MCGIAGIIGPKPTEVTLRKMLQKQIHRGPDHTGIFIDEGAAGLGHNRLSIIDLSAKANEPFIDPSGRFSLTFNGEIYNYIELRKELESLYKFRTSSDTEVLLAGYLRWGKDCLQKFNGMFAFAIWDKQERKLFAARDPFGVKPFYYTLSDGHFFFSSEIKGILEVIEKVPNRKVWANYFTHGSYGHPTETFYKGVLQLQGGHYLEYSDNHLHLEQWYLFEKRISELYISSNFEEAKRHYLHLLKKSIELRFRADVPVAINISGGVDSSLLLALIDRFEKKDNIKAYTFYTGHEKYDELPWVEKMIESTDHPLCKVQIRPQEVETTALFVNEIQDEPFGGIPTLAYSKIFEQAQKDGVKVLLDGQGMDEQWAGYDYYHTKSGFTTQGVGHKNPFKKNVLNPDFAGLAENPVYPEPFENLIQNLQYRDLFFTKIPRALRFNDRISMAHSTELREPFLDYRLVEFAFSQPDNFKIRNGIQKFILREILKPLIPKDISYAPKRPLQTPQREWLAEELNGFVNTHLEALLNSSASEWFNHLEIQKEWKNYLNGDRESSFHIWQWVNASLLLQKL